MKSSMGYTEQSLLVQLVQWLGAILINTFFTSIFVLFYFYSGVHVYDPTGATDYKWKPHQFSGNMNEGFAHFFMDDNGFNNLDSLQKNIDVLLMGASHMEAAQIPQSRNVVSILNSETKYTAYNIAIAGHSFLTNLDNLENALRAYNPRKAVVIHTDVLDFSEEEWDMLKYGNMQDMSYSRPGLLLQLRNIPSLKIIYKQLVDKSKKDFEPIKRILKNNKRLLPFFNGNDREYTNFEVITACLRKASKISTDYGCHLIVEYTPSVGIKENGTLFRRDNKEYIKKFKNICNQYGIIFSDLYSIFEAKYESNHILPYGFQNSVVGEGHLNIIGHRILADQLIKDLQL